MSIVDEDDDNRIGDPDYVPCKYIFFFSTFEVIRIHIQSRTRFDKKNYIYFVDYDLRQS